MEAGGLPGQHRKPDHDDHPESGENLKYLNKFPLENENIPMNTHPKKTAMIHRLKWAMPVAVLLLLQPLCISGQQKRAFEPEDYPLIENITSRGISANGQFIYHVISPMQYGDPKLVVTQVKSNRTDTFDRAKSVWFADDGSWMAYIREPIFAEVRAAKLKDPKAAEKFDDTLVVLLLAGNRKEYLYPAVKEVVVPEERNGMLLTALLKTKKAAEVPSDTLTPEEEKRDSFLQNAKKPSAKKGEEKRFRLLILDPLTGKETIEPYVVAARWSPFAGVMAYITQPVDTLPAQQLLLYHPKKSLSESIYLSEGMLKHPAFSFDEHQVAVLDQRDTADEKNGRVLNFSTRKRDTFQVVLPLNGWVFNPHHALYYLEKSHKLITHLAFPEVKPTKDSVLKEELYTLDLWKWDEPYLQSQQLKDLDKEKKRGYCMVVDPATGVRLMAEDSLLRNSNLSRQSTNRYLLSWDDRKYAMESNWTGGAKYDLWLLDLVDGTRRLVSEGHERMMTFSPDESSLVWYDKNDSTWRGLRTATLEPFCITCGLNIPFYNDQHDNPGPAPSYGIAGWGEEGRFLFLNGKYDIWKMDLSGKLPPMCLTGDGKSNRELVYRLLRIEHRKISYRGKDQMVFSIFNSTTRESGFATMNYHKPGIPAKIVYGPWRFSGLEKARSAERFIWRRESASEYPELWTDLMPFDFPKQVSMVGSQYQQFFGGTTSLVKWQTDDGIWYEGLLSMPEHHDGSSGLPMVVTFYERSADGLHSFRHYAPSRSVINTAHYLSHGYAVFEPDIYYGLGTPGDDAMKAVVSGTKYVISLGKVDPARIGIQGQSWGGYQVAYLITKTDMFAAAMAGAAVSNMTSAYGAIRWESGRPRMFQYEMGQSRLGTTLWDGGFQRYFENSPLFFADRVHTPLLMMHNDNDGAVPWSQSVEYLLALRRLGKPAWLLVYNNEAHNLLKWPNRVDLSIRMMQFFDHYLKGSSPPAWMNEGRPAEIKGVDDRYQLVD
jgi:dienelactone hydrolase